MHNAEGRNHPAAKKGFMPKDTVPGCQEPSRHPGLDRGRQSLRLERPEQERPPAFQRDLYSPVPRDIVGPPLPPYPDSPASVLKDRPVGNSLCFDNGGEGQFPPLEMEGEHTKPEVGPCDLDLESHHDEPDREEEPEYHKEDNYQDVGGRVCPERLPYHDLQEEGIPCE